MCFERRAAQPVGFQASAVVWQINSHYSLSSFLELRCEQTAIDFHCLTGGVGQPAGCQRRDRCRDFGRLSPAPNHCLAIGNEFIAMMKDSFVGFSRDD